MSRPRVELAQIRRLCPQGDTIARAEMLLSQAKAKTGPGSGFDLGQGSAGLAAICAYLASKELGNADVAENTAQHTSCLHPKLFQQTLKLVRAALGVDKRKVGQRSRMLYYDRLVQEFSFRRGDFMVSCMEAAENTIIQNRELRGKMTPPNDTVTLAVFLWSCGLMKIYRARMDTLHEEYDISMQDLEQVRQVLNSTCQDVAAEIKLKVQALRAGASRALKQPMKRSYPPSPSKSAVQKSPSKSVLRAASVTFSLTQTPTHKRVMFSQDEDMDDTSMDTPTRKKAKTSGSYDAVAPQTPSSDPLDFPETAKTPHDRRASSSKVTLELLERATQQPSDSEGEIEDITMLTSSEPPLAVAPSTPRRKKRSALFPSTPGEFDVTPGRRVRLRGVEGRNGDDDEEEDDGGLPRRHRPILLGHKQWLQRDPRTERQRVLAGETQKSMIGKYGHPFEHLRPAALAS